MPLSVSHVFRTCAVGEVGALVVGSIPIEVPHFHSLGTRPLECCHHETVDTYALDTVVRIEVNNHIPGLNAIVTLRDGGPVSLPGLPKGQLIGWPVKMSSFHRRWKRLMLSLSMVRSISRPSATFHARTSRTRSS